MVQTSNKVRVTADLPVDSIETLIKLADHQNITLTEAMRRAICTDALLQEKRDAGHKVLLETRGHFSELIFLRHPSCQIS